MKTSTPTSPGPKGPPSILLRGAPGSHKTTFSLQFPSVGILDTDENLAGPERYIREVLKKPIEYVYSRIRYDEADQPVHDQKQWWTKYCNDFNAMVKDPAIKTIVTDSLTGLDEVLLRRTMSDQGRTDEMRQQDWIPFRLKLREIMFKMRQTGKANIVICHEESKKDREGNIIAYDIFLSSKLSDIFGWIFTDVWYIEAQPDIGGKQRPSKLFCSPVGLRKDLKNSSLMPQEMEATFENVNKYLKL